MRNDGDSKRAGLLVILAMMGALVGGTGAHATVLRQQECVAQVIYWEARGQSVAGQVAVAQVVLNRTRHPAFPQDACGVVYQKVGRTCQFSWACNRRRGQPHGEEWEASLRLARVVMHQTLPAMVGHAMYFHEARSNPGWRHLRRVATIDGHIFYAERTR